MLAHIRPALVMIVLFTILTGLIYPLAITGIAKVALPYQAGGSLLHRPDGSIEGSILIAQAFAKPEYLHPRGSSAGNGYDATASSPSNLGPMDKKLADRIAGDAAALKKEAPGVPIPADAVTQSGSGLDPDVSPENATRQAPRIAQARGVPATEVQAVIARNTMQPALGFIGQPHVNVLAVNRALDAQYPLHPARS
ncbi:potassium-transporting ATPase subunit KdpC [Caulobacter sp. S45]|uniref:potassium-transporting ATPase subunit KdpC n=1 Tax=Caulobacter sp. S45 TaxID=1641861 RepID=UPI00131C93BA|nr:potassium-transporting ATPase subunit KdpC [Caulobacter sp. S45]